MTIRVLLALLSAALVSFAASCGSSSPVERGTSARGIITTKPSSGGTGRAGRGATIYFYDDGSSSTEGPIVGWEWNFGAGWEDCDDTEGICSHTFTEPGTYNAHLRVTDSTGKKGSEKIKVQIVEGANADPVFVVLGSPFESFSDKRGSDGKSLRYHNWRWRCLSYDPEDVSYRESPTLNINRQLPPGDPDFDLLVCHSEGDPDFDFCGIDIDGDGMGDDLDSDKTDDDPSVKRVFVLPHVLEVSGTCLSKSKEDVYVWKIKAVGANGEGKKEYVGHVSLLK